MNRYVLYENSYYDLQNTDKEVLSDFVNIGVQIKEELGLITIPIQFVSSNKIYIGSIVGNVILNDTNLLILPKFTLGFESHDKEVIKRLFLRTIKCASGSLGTTVYFQRNSVVENQSLFFDVLAKAFYDSTIQALKKSKIYLYEDRIEKISSIKGRVLVQKQLSYPIMDEKTWCKFRKMTINNIYNQLLFWSCKYLAELTKNFDIKRKLLNLSREFPQQTDLLSITSVGLVRVPRQFSEFSESINLAKGLYLKDIGKKEKMSNGQHICGYVINMQRSFENIVCFYSRVASKTLGCFHKSQAVKQLAESSYNHEFDYDVRPDDLISRNGKCLIVDAKYKTISMQDTYKKKPSRDDFYQMVSSCIAYSCSEAVLIYPNTESFPHMHWKTLDSVNGKKITIRASSVESDMVDAFTDIIKETFFIRENIHG